MEIAKLVKGNHVTFLRYRQQHLYYMIKHEDVSYSFPVPLEDLQDAEVSCTEKAITMMRYIRKAISDGTLVVIK